MKYYYHYTQQTDLMFLVQELNTLDNALILKEC